MRRKDIKNFKKTIKLIFLSLFLISCFVSYIKGDFSKKDNINTKNITSTKNISSRKNTVKNKEKILEKTSEVLKIDVDNLPKFEGRAFVVINKNEPFFENENLKNTSFEDYSNLDNLGRCGVANSIIGKDIMPDKKRENISSVKPTGWQKIRFDEIDGKSLYNRCHLIGFQLAGENANKKNLITGTRFLNVKGMLPFENMVCDYVKETNNHVRYRVTPIFLKDELVARGVQMEAFSIEDNGKSIKFNVYCFNNQPGIEINYKNGKAKRIK